MARKTKIRLAVLIAAIAGLTFAGILLKHLLDPFDDQPFEKSAWAMGDHQGRAAMARSAIHTIPIGLPAAQVEALLGQGEAVQRDSRNKDVDIFGNPLRYPETWSYSLGRSSLASLWGLDAAYLYIHFDSDKKVAAAEITGG